MEDEAEIFEGLRLQFPLSFNKQSKSETPLELIHNTTRRATAAAAYSTVVSLDKLSTSTSTDKANGFPSLSTPLKMDEKRMGMMMMMMGQLLGRLDHLLAAWSLILTKIWMKKMRILCNMGNMNLGKMSNMGKMSPTMMKKMNLGNMGMRICSNGRQ
ncbi:hypothetical protein Salat_2420500 [Sesamum alatum]|uniref:Uncharacterized protein n=1 Tax=Sesamum alatum TaxID=300844 RepID=A0AAE1XYT1_9LAMI|nr:hypothetical protein Salat_2420500 [Sesamum alatum]